MLRKRSDGTARGTRFAPVIANLASGTIDRRTFLRRSGLAAAGLGVASVPLMGVRSSAETKAPAESGSPVQVKNSVCTFCAVGCAIKAEVQDGVWIRQAPAFDSPINNGGYCAKGAAVRDETNSVRRLRYPMKLVGGKWQRVSWDQAIGEIGDQMMKIRKESGPDSVYWLGSAKHSNEQAYLFRKYAAFWGSNNTDHQARICHSSTVAGVANTWGYGAMTNSFPDMHNSRAIITFGGNPAEAHPVSMLHILKAKEQNNAAFIVVDPRFTRTAAHATEHVQSRPGTDIAVIWGILWHIFENEWEDKEYIRQRVWGMDHIREEVRRWTPEEVERVSGVPGSQLRRVARTLVTSKPVCLTWTLGMTQHTIGSSNTRAMPILQLALGNVGKEGGGTNIFRGHDNVQGATDMGVLCHTLPGYYGLSTGAWKHWSRVWDVDYEWLKGQFADQKLMETAGTPVSRWYELVLQDKKDIDQPDNLRAMVFWGHSVNSLTRLPEHWKAFDKLELLVLVDPYVPLSAIINDRTDGVYMLPAASQFETTGSVTASNRSLQWREKVVEPIFESKPDHEIMYLFAQKFGYADKLFKNIKVNGSEPFIDDILREMNRGLWTIGYTGQSPERLRLHMQNQQTFDKTTLRANGGPCDGEYYGLPWPCWGTPEMKHPGTPNLYDPSKEVSQGGLGFRARFGVEAPKEWGGGNLLAEGGVEGSTYPLGSEIKDGYPEFTMAMLKKLGWDKDLTDAERAAIEKVAGDKTNWKTDLSGGIQRVAVKHGCAPFGNAKARCVVWGFPDPIPVHREPLYTPRRDLVADYPTYEDTRMYRLPIKYASIQKQDFSKEFPLVLSSGCLVEQEGGGAKSFANIWLAELQQNMFAQINPRDANNIGIKDGDMVFVESPEGGSIKVKARVSETVARGNVWVPYHFGGHFQGKDLSGKYPDGTGPYVMGESGNIIMTYGYDSVTNIQENKVSICRIRAA
ncbi:formate dehydrogenase major subunit [Tistlia consotensis]|uniref:Formate dehydrogenase major subunit n=1 Tax=Tistlia consotensis USBA 355 TaxID=560819 RepID=A0A1Y6CDE0_9PROT|nr:molybdopterin-dependent oxidoreductase [Tistlia consotensis]SMF55596.1 formate dehydrogenase major subunit [Tistlia consotensis USBA 355]SNR88783.1 formate dehydrogenase major subunit [Tistlia consotensis]